MTKRITIEEVLKNIPTKEKNPRLEHFIRRYFKESDETQDVKEIVSAVMSAWNYFKNNQEFGNSKSLKWFDEFYEKIAVITPKKEADRLLEKYGYAFPDAYTNRYSPKRAICDIYKMEEAIANDDIVLELYDHEKIPSEHFHLKIYNPEKLLPLSEIMPLLENMGLKVIEENPYAIKLRDESKIWIRDYRFEVADCKKPNIAEIKEKFEETLRKLWGKKVENDFFNCLTVRAGMDTNEIMIFRAYAEYIRQTNIAYSFGYMSKTICRYPEIAKLIRDLFNARFCPTQKGDAAKIEAQIEKALAKVENIDADTIIRRFVDTIKATIRTNRFKEKSPAYISFKIDSSKMADLPAPIPFVEVFVHSPYMKGIHLRGGKVARGGLRWSDRSEDFRTEILGLMKAQIVKNAVIVPVGSKGGFVLKYPPEDRAEFQQLGVESYKNFLRGILDLTDNIVDDKIVPPKNVVRYDEDDPYLVVAADKGTATFSDIANEISNEYGFWLGDAFASGGSAGYDHKKMGITAKGAWISVQRHFMEMGVDIQKTDFTVIGIGDMAGDVFGNGMLLSKHIRLQGAFNHMHIFVDPNPDSAKSFKERKRMFNLARSSWEDYNKELISKGGGIFSRSSKKIEITPEMKDAFDIKADNLKPNELIKAMLKAPVDLLWNGGIGTYVKATNETNADAGDRANDALRINGCELNCQVVGEGGNLGLTQLGRIEYASSGGRINTDAIDNSAGVDCSDHEVNIKIALYDAYKNGDLTRVERDKLLAEMTDEVSKLVLRDNSLQAQAISLIEFNNHKMCEVQAELMNTMEKDGLLDRRIEFLPSNEELTERFANKQGLTRPEISVLFSYSKIALYESLFNSHIPDDPYFEEDLIKYFPTAMHANFKGVIKNHKLRKEIVATIVTNSLINRVGHTFFNQMVEDTGVHPCDVARAYVTIRDTFDLRTLWREIEELEKSVDDKVILEMFVEVNNFITHCTKWFLRNCPQPLDITGLMKTYADGVAEVSSKLNCVINNDIKIRLKEKGKYYQELNVPKPLSKKIADLTMLTSALDIIFVSNDSGCSLEDVGRTYYELGEKLQFTWLREKVSKIESSSHWQTLALTLLMADLYDEQRRLTSKVVSDICKNGKCIGSMDKWIEENEGDLSRYYHFLDMLKTMEHLTLEMAVIAVTKVQEICSV